MGDSSSATAGLSTAPDWCLALGQVGNVLLIVGALLFVLCAVANALDKNGALHPAFTRWTFNLGGTAIFGAFAILAILFIGDQFEFNYVASHSIQDLVPVYKLAAVWSGQEGSFLLWAVTSSLFGLIAIRGTGPYRRWFAVVYAIFLATLCGILSYETPFNLIPDFVVGGQVFIPARGLGLVASLQNYWVVIHPPVIFLGFGALTVPFAYAFSAILSRDVVAWAPRVRAWALLSLSVLGAGLVMGGLWAYETQGWGGFWAWDPVENVSLVPWLMNAALVHGLLVQVTRSRWHWGNLLLGAAPFLLFLYGTFLTRSGFLSKFSVHSFAEMNRSALWLLMALLVAAVVAFFAAWLTRGRKLAHAADSHEAAMLGSRESGFRAGILILSGLAVTVAIGMSIPFFLGLAGKDARVVEEPQYHVVTFWFFAAAMLLMTIVPFLTWRHRPGVKLWSQLARTMGTAALLVAICLFALLRSDWRTRADMSAKLDFPFGMTEARIPWVVFLFALTAMAISTNGWRVLEVLKRSKLGFGGFLAHMGVAVALGGLILSRGLERKEQVMVMDGTPGEGLGYAVQYVRMTSDPETDRSNRVVFRLATLDGAGKQGVSVQPGYFFTTAPNGDAEPFTSPAIARSLTHDVYVSLGTPQMNLFDQPEHFAVGETKTGVGVSITYLGLTEHGALGTSQASFGARIKVVEDGRTYFAEPTYSLASGPNVVDASPSLRATLGGIDASDKSIMLQLPYTRTVYPLELYYKPMTILVWLGAGIMASGGLIAAFYRRPPKPGPTSA
ncbi:MAG: cytochrome c biogenesis protein CcsA [Fimbriimonadaceae bacterium]